MPPRLQSRLLWLALVLCVPLPFYLLETGLQPVAATTQMLLVTLALIATEGRAGAAATAAWILAVQAVLGAALLAVVAAAVTRTVDRLAGARSTTVVCVLVAALFGFALTQPIYRTPFRTAGLRATFSEVFE